VPPEGRGKAAHFIPIRHVFRNKLTKEDKVLMAFDAFVLGTALGREIGVGKIIHGDDHAALKVKTSALAGGVRKSLGKMAALLSSSGPPGLVLIRHCGECDYRDQCRQKAIEKDDLSLLAGMSAKERQKLRSKGIFTVTQLSYTFRPRRRPKRLRDKRERYHHALKALAIREKKIHIVGSPELKIEGTPVDLDVEGLPDRDFYYLIGLRIGDGDTAVQHSLWADTVADEGKIWREFLAILETVEKPVLIHYGSFETVFLKRMNERHGTLQQNRATGGAIPATINLLSFLYGRVYYPTHSNRLMDLVALSGELGNIHVVSGIQTIAWRHDWEKSRDSSIRSRLIAHNRDDCDALERLTAETVNVLTKPESRPDVGHAEASENATTPQATEIHRAFRWVLRSAYSDYSKSRIKLTEPGKVESGSDLRQRRRPATRPRLPAVRGHIIRFPRKRKCERHPEHPMLLRPTRKPAERALIDLAFSSTGCRKSVLRLLGKRGRCPYCKECYVPPGFKQMQNMVHGPGFVLWIVYLKTALRLSYRLITQATRDLFGVDISPVNLRYFVSRCANDHATTEQQLQDRILHSPAVHVDETKLSILGQHQFVWVLTDGKHVIFRLTEGRETGFLEPLLANYQGTLVSDFYGGIRRAPVPTTEVSRASDWRPE